MADDLEILESGKLAGNALGVEWFKASDGRTFYVTRHGWIIDHTGKSIRHPEVDDVQDAIARREFVLRGGA